MTFKNLVDVIGTPDYNASANPYLNVQMVTWLQVPSVNRSN